MMKGAIYEENIAIRNIHTLNKRAAKKKKRSENWQKWRGKWTIKRDNNKRRNSMIIITYLSTPL